MPAMTLTTNPGEGHTTKFKIRMKALNERSKVQIGLVSWSVSAQMCADQYGREK